MFCHGALWFFPLEAAGSIETAKGKDLPMKKSIVLLSALAAATFAGAAFAQEPPAGPMGRDTDGDGYISRAEMTAQVQLRFDEIDSNGDGVISFEEYSVGSQSAFDKADTNADDLLSQEELQAGHTERSERRDRRRGRRG